MSERPREPGDAWVRLASLFRQALELPASERARFLDGLSGADAALHDELASLLTAHDALEAAETREGTNGEPFLESLNAVRAAALLQGPGVSGPEPGEMIGPYRVLGPLGQGGMGVVYLAEDPRLDRKVALKLLPPWVGGDLGARRRLMSEARAASALDHPNIATIYEVDEARDGRPYIAMAYYDGDSLARRIGQGPMEVDAALGIARQVAAGLAAAHAHGIVHRDVKAANVTFGAEGMVKILDFGIAKGAGAGPTGTGATMGTVAYMSPEQLRGEEVDARADVWAWGVLVYEMLTGRRPFDGDAPDAVIYQIRHDEPTPLEALRPDVPESVAGLVASCLRKDPGGRPGSALELVRALGGPVPAAAGSTGSERSGTPDVRSRARAPGLVAALALATVAWLLFGGPTSSLVPADERSLAVLPFENLAGSTDAELYVRGIHDDVVTHLSTVSGFRVTSRQAVERFRESDVPTARIADDLGVRWVLEGGVLKVGDRIQVSARLIDPRTEFQAWAGRYERDLTAPDLFALQRDITLEIARSLDTRITPDERERFDRTPTADLAAYGRYVQGRTLLDQRSESGLRQGAARFREAIRLDSAYAPAWAALADALTLLVYYGYAPRDSVLPEALAAAERALSLDDGLAEAHASRGLIYQTLRHDGPEARMALEEAVRLNPSYARAHHWLGALLLNLGRLEDARDPLIRAAELDPTSPAIRISLGRWYQYADSLGQALDQAGRAEGLSPSYPSGLMLTGEILRTMGRLEEARAALERALELPGVNPTGYPGIWVELATVSRSLNDTARTRQLVEQLETAPPFVRSALPAGAGHRDAALTLLSRSPVIPELASVLRYHPIFDPIRGDPRFEEVLRAYDRAWGVAPEVESR